MLSVTNKHFMLCAVMLSVTNKHFMLSSVILNVVMLSVVVPGNLYGSSGCNHLYNLRLIVILGNGVLTNILAPCLCLAKQVLYKPWA